MTIGKKVAVVQSNYIPWKGYFDLIASVDEFILYDDMQYTRRDWRNRNKIVTPQGLLWLTVPVIVKGRYYQKIYDTELDGVQWAQRHWRSLSINYKRAKHYEDIAFWLEPLYQTQNFTHLSELNRKLIEVVCRYLGINTLIKNSSDYELIEGKTARLADLCKQAGAHEYVSGPAAQNYIDEKVFEEYGIALKWFDYSGYPTYPQMAKNFTHGVSIIDLLFNCGVESKKYMKFAQ